MPITVVPGSNDSPDMATVMAVDPSGATVGAASVSRLYGARGGLAISVRDELELHDHDGVLHALVGGIETAARTRGLHRVELDADDLDPAVFLALVGVGLRRNLPLQLSWSTITR